MALTKTALKALLLGRKLPKTATNKVIREFLKVGAKSAPKSKAFAKAVTTLKSQAGAASSSALGIGAVVGAGAVGAYAINKKKKNVIKEIEKTGKKIMKSNKATYQRVKGYQAAKKLIRGSKKYSPKKK